MILEFDELQSLVEVLNQDEFELEINEREEIEAAIHEAIVTVKVKLDPVPSSRPSVGNLHHAMIPHLSSRSIHMPVQIIR